MTNQRVKKILSFILKMSSFIKEYWVPFIYLHHVIFVSNSVRKVCECAKVLSIRSMWLCFLIRYYSPSLYFLMTRNWVIKIKSWRNQPWYSFWAWLKHSFPQKIWNFKALIILHNLKFKFVCKHHGKRPNNLEINDATFLFHFVKANT